MTIILMPAKRRSRARSAAASAALFETAASVKSFTSFSRKKKLSADKICPAASEAAASGCAGRRSAAKASAMSHETRSARWRRLAFVPLRPRNRDLVLPLGQPDDLDGLAH